MIATTVCRRGVYIHSPVARTFFCVQRAHCVLRTLLMRVTRAWLKGAKKVLCTCVISLHLTDSSLMSHPSLLFLDGHFETIPDADIHKFLPYLLVLKAQGMRISARGREVWLSGQVRPQHRLWSQEVRQDHFCGQWHDAHWRSWPQWNLWLLEKHTPEHWTVWCSHNVWILCFARFSWWFCSSNSKESMHRETDC